MTPDPRWKLEEEEEEEPAEEIEPDMDDFLTPEEQEDLLADALDIYDRERYR